MSGGPGRRELGTVLFVDVVDSTRRLVHVGDEAWARLLDAFESDCAREVESRQGRVVKTTGDGVLATMPTPTSAVDCSDALHHAAHELGIAIRAGIHCGELQGRGDDVAGVTVHVAARLMGAAAAGETLVSNPVVLMSEPETGPFVARGPVAVKGLADPVEVFAIPSGVALEVPAPPDVTIEALRRQLERGEVDYVTALVHENLDPGELADLLIQAPARGEFLSVNLSLVRTMQDVATRLPADDDARRSRLQAKLAFEMRGDPTTLDERRALLASAAEHAERSGDDEALVDALLARVHALWEPAGALERLAAVDRAVEAARRSRLLDRELDARIARVDALVELGRVTDAEFELTTYGRLAPAHRRDLQTFLASRRATLATIRGRLDAVLREAEVAESHAAAAGMQDVRRMGMMLRAVVIREKGDLAALAASAEAILEQSVRNPGHYFEANAARCLLECGRPDQARAELARALPSLLGTYGYRWLAAAYDAALVAVAVGTAEDCERLYDALFDHRGRFVVTGAGFWGYTPTVLGALAARLGRDHVALELYDQAVVDLDAMAALSWAAHARAGRARVYRGLGDHRAEADQQRALETARALGMTVLVTSLTETPEGAGVWTLASEGDTWLLKAGDEVARLRHSRGLEHLRTLLANPGQLVAALSLESGGAVTWAPGGPEVLDDAAKSAYRARLDRIASDLEAADQRGDERGSRSLEEERAHLVAELQRASGLGGRTRRSSDATERARVNVTRNLRRTLELIGRDAPAAALHLQQSVSTGTYCCYDPAPGGPERWRT